MASLRQFLLAVLPSGVEVIRGQENRTPEPLILDFVTMTPLFRERLETNTDSYSDFEILTFVSPLTNIPTVGDVLVNAGLTAAGVITAISGLNIAVTPTPGKYFAAADTVLDQTSSLATGTLASVAYGNKIVMQPTKMTVQLDVHGPNSGDNAQIISTLFRDEYAVDQFETSGYGVVPLYADDPKQIPFFNGEQQVEERWVVDAVMQCNPFVGIPLQFADALGPVNVISVDALYPPEWDALFNALGTPFVLNDSTMGVLS